MNPQPQWHFTGSVPENYERYLVPTIFASWAEDLVELAALQPSDQVLDIACGTGIVARIAARKLGVGGTVVGFDLSAPMVAAARSIAANEGVSVEWREGSAVMLPLGDKAFDVVFCQQGLQFFPDRPAALREMHRVLAEGGRLVLSVWREIEHSPGFAALAQALARHLGPEACALMTAGPFALSDMQELHALIAGASFTHITIRPVVKTLRYLSPDEFVLQYAAGSALASVLASAGEKARTELLAEIGTKLGSYFDDQGLAFPIESNIVIAHR
jgi:ubiquinone/menaquinone biosynthesis C-methylase UbiE